MYGIGKEHLFACSPPTRGWTVVPWRIPAAPTVFPAHAGMDRCRHQPGGPRAGVPRPRGDGPTGVDPNSLVEMCSPPTRGWTGAAPVRDRGGRVFPAHAGMDRRAITGSPFRPGVPRPRGDGPTLVPDRSSPHMVFPAHAGMDRSRAHHRRLVPPAPDVKRPRGPEAARPLTVRRRHPVPPEFMPRR